MGADRLRCVLNQVWPHGALVVQSVTALVAWCSWHCPHEARRVMYASNTISVTARRVRGKESRASPPCRCIRPLRVGLASLLRAFMLISLGPSAPPEPLAIIDQDLVALSNATFSLARLGLGKNPHGHAPLAQPSVPRLDKLGVGRRGDAAVVVDEARLVAALGSVDGQARLAVQPQVVVGLEAVLVVVKATRARVHLADVGHDDGRGRQVLGGEEAALAAGRVRRSGGDGLDAHGGGGAQRDVVGDLGRGGCGRR